MTEYRKQPVKGVAMSDQEMDRVEGAENFPFARPFPRKLYPTVNTIRCRRLSNSARSKA